MFNKISSEQTAHYTAFMMLLLELFKFNVTDSEIETLIKGILGLGSLVYAWYKRYERGDIFLSGIRK